MELSKYLLLLLLLIQVNASKLRWQPKREIGNTTIWKSTQDQRVRASTQVLKSSKSYLASLNNREQFVKGLEKKKREGMKFLGISEWKAAKYNWGKDQLTINGHYIDRKGQKNYFYERHYFRKDRRVISLITSIDKKRLDQKTANNFFEATLSWESRK